MNVSLQVVAKRVPSAFHETLETAFGCVNVYDAEESVAPCSLLLISQIWTMFCEAVAII
jgi:hypothetical protein